MKKLIVVTTLTLLGLGSFSPTIPTPIPSNQCVEIWSDDGPFFPPDPFEDDQGFCGCGAGSCCNG